MIKKLEWWCKKYVLGFFLKLLVLKSDWLHFGRHFLAAVPTWLKGCSPNLVFCAGFWYRQWLAGLKPRRDEHAVVRPLVGMNKAMWVLDNWIYMVPWLGVSYEMSSLHVLQQSDEQFRKACECSVAVVESTEYESRDQTLCDFFTSRTMD